PVSDVTQTPGARHPMLRTHPATGRTALFLGRRQNSYVLGLPVAESEALLDEVWAHATRDENTWHHSWRPGDLVIWDNRCAMHHRNAFDTATRRFMLRTQVKGDRPYLAAT
ncbi:MAG: TauD/TfdA family dioxygenase, partial [Alphaproteobacteria bacterium]|nr:TauD/TfdA family dioxygenase [Alphaproteobacteria bacterium]